MFFLKVLIYAICALASTSYFIVKVSLNYWKRRGILHKPPHKLWGHLKGLGRKYHLSDILQQHYHTYKGQAPFIGFYVWLKPMILILDIDLVNCILDKDNKQFTKIAYFNSAHYNNLSIWPNNNNHLKWQQLNSTNVYEFTTINFKCIHKTMELYLKENITNTQEMTINISEMIESFNIAMISNIIFDLSINNATAINATSYSYSKSQFNFVAMRYIKNNINVHKTRCNSSCQMWTNIMHSNTKHKINLHDNLIKMLLDMKKELNPSQSADHFNTLDKESCNEIFNYLLSTLEILNTMFVCCLYELAKQPAIQSRANIEIEKVLQYHNNELTEEALKDLVYLKQIVNETLRKHTPYPFMLRVTANDYEIVKSVFMLKKGNHLIIPIAAVHHDEKYYANPYKYDPDHFHEAQVHKRPTQAFIPFGLGPRSCIAQQFISFYMLTGLVTLLRGFQYKLSMETPDCLEYNRSVLFLTLKNDMKLLVKEI